MRKGILLAVCALALITMLVGCGSAESNPEPTSTTIQLGKNGQITYYLVEDFDKDYYKLSELSDMAKEEASEFNQKYPMETGEAVSILEVKNLDGNIPKAMIQYRFSDDSFFEEFTESQLYYGTVDEALKQGFHVRGTLGNTKGTDQISELELTTMDSYMALFTELKYCVYTERKVVYMSPGAVILDDGCVDLTNVEGTAILIMK